ncbi:MAG: Lipoprotein-releasing system ATP-binding protein LolD [Spirochaetes bacterium ADurb.BinA120]|jgi:lipoprotein-releasing system ATP-binding protein|nr:MAG: Lipoprotein-releasing system ATP-binding protein LolD [Spirochaetes bacterium ADurb.BinA120]
MEKSAIIKADGIEKVYGTGRNALRVLKGVSLSIGEGEIVSIMGPSGAGKSTLLNVMGCLDGFQSGSLSVLGRELSGLSVEDLSMFRNRHIGFVFQLHNLLPDFTALENVMMPMLIRRDRRQAARAAAISVIERFGMEDRLDHRPGELSGGECQRIAVARAIVGRPDIILADEPTGSLDSENSRVLMNTLFELGRENGATIVVVTHDAGIASITGRTITIVDGSITETQ